MSEPFEPTEITPGTSTSEAAAPRHEAAESGSEGSPWGRRLWQEWLKPFLFVLVIVCSLRSAVADWNDVPSGSMRPTILEGERIFVNKIAYDLKVPFTRVRLWEWGNPRRGDVVVLFSPSDGKRLVKRVVGLPGDRIALRQDRLFINGARVAYAPLGEETREDLAIREGGLEKVMMESLGHRDHPVTWTQLQPMMSNYGPVEVPAGSYFVMGDNRDNSRDSRYFGFVDREAIVGRATAVVTSFDASHKFPALLLHPRWDRFFHTLP